MTTAPSFIDRRFVVDEPSAMFAAMKPGQYLPGDTWASRVVFARA